MAKSVDTSPKVKLKSINEILQTNLWKCSETSTDRHVECVTTVVSVASIYCTKLNLKHYKVTGKVRMQYV